MTQPQLHHGKDPVPIVQKAGWASGPVWTGAENLACSWIRSSDRPARRQSLYRLRYPAHTNWSTRRKSCHVANSSLKIPKWNDTWSNPDPRGERAATYGFSHDTTPFLFTTFMRRTFLRFLESTSTTKYILNSLLLCFRLTVPRFCLAEAWVLSRRRPCGICYESKWYWDNIFSEYFGFTVLLLSSSSPI